MRHAGTQEIETERLILRRLTPEDAGMMYMNWANDPQVTKYCGGSRTKTPKRPANC